MPKSAPLARRQPVRRPAPARFRDIAPHAVALMVTDEASRWLGEPLPAAWTGWLIRRARGCIAHNPRWRARFRRCSERGRATLWVFMRHWLAARLHAERPALFRRLPSDYCIGAELPASAPPAPTASPWSSPDVHLLQ
jgi:hypothetical protein